MIWALVGFVIVAVFTAMFTNIMNDTVARPEKINGARVGVLQGSLERLRVIQSGGTPVGINERGLMSEFRARLKFKKF